MCLLVDYLIEMTLSILHMLLGACLRELQSNSVPIVGVWHAKPLPQVGMMTGMLFSRKPLSLQLI